SGSTQADNSHPGTTGGGTDHDPAIMMTLVKGNYSPPKKWTKDGGVTVIAKGDQRIDLIAATRFAGTEPPAVKDTTSQTKHGKPIKVTQFAMLDPPQAGTQPRSFAQVLSGVQAYAAPDPRDNGAPQSAIALAAAAPGPETPAQPAVQLRGPVDAATPRETPASQPAVTKSAPIKPAPIKTASAKPPAPKKQIGKTSVAKAVPATAAPAPTVVAEAPAPAPVAPPAEPATNAPATPYGTLSGSAAPVVPAGFMRTSAENYATAPSAETARPAVIPASSKPKAAAKAGSPTKTATRPIQLHVASAEKPTPVHKHLALATKVETPEAK
ncbi:MAG: hypothetical protein P4L76_04370, partial [Beijerinckiaceae bacterium]|nr:hypothetical protein [Beijerinckiaceae bacterium]